MFDKNDGHEILLHNIELTKTNQPNSRLPLKGLFSYKLELVQKSL